MSDELDLTNKRNLSIDYLNVVFSAYSDGLYDAPGEFVGGFNFASVLGIEMDDLEDGKGVYGYTVSKRGDGVLVAWSDNNSSSVLYSLSGQACSIYDVTNPEKLVKILNYIKKNAGWVSRIDIALDVADNTVFPLSKMIEKLENQEFTSKKRRFNRFDERDASGNLLASTVYFGKSRADSGTKGNLYLRAYRKDLELVSKGGGVPDWAKGCERLERFEISINGKAKTNKVCDEILKKGGVLEPVHLGLLNGIVRFKDRPKGEDKKKSRWPDDKDWMLFLEEHQAIQVSNKPHKSLYSTLGWLSQSVIPVISALAEVSKENHIDFWKILKEATAETSASEVTNKTIQKDVKNLKSRRIRNLLRSGLSVDEKV